MRVVSWQHGAGAPTKMAFLEKSGTYKEKPQTENILGLFVDMALSGRTITPTLLDNHPSPRNYQGGLSLPLPLQTHYQG